MPDAIVTLTYHLQLADGTYEAVPMGIFEASEANRKAKCLEIKAYDYMVHFEKNFNGYESVGNAYDFMTLCANSCAVELEQDRETDDGLTINSYVKNIMLETKIDELVDAFMSAIPTVLKSRLQAV